MHHSEIERFGSGLGATLGYMTPLERFTHWLLKPRDTKCAHCGAKITRARIAGTAYCDDACEHEAQLANAY